MKRTAWLAALICCFAACGDDADGGGGGEDGGSSGSSGGESDGGGGGASGSAGGESGDGGGGGSSGSTGGESGDAGPDASTDASADASAGDAGASADVTPEDGGSVTLGDIEVVVPAGAVSETTTITVRELGASEVAALPAGFQAIGPAVALLPHGLSFAEPVSITLGHSGSASSTLALFRLDDESDTTWEELSEAVFAASSVTVETTRFSVLAPGAEDPPGDAGADGSTNGDGDAGGGTSVTGRVVDQVDLPLQGVSVMIGSATGVTDAAGEFTIADVPATYDAVVINQDIVETPFVYRALTRRDPVFRFTRPDGTEHSTTLTGTTVPPGNDEGVAILFGSSEVWAITRPLADGSFSMPVSWSGPASTMGTLHTLRWQGSAFDLVYTAYGSMPFTLTGAGQQVSVQTSPISSGSVSGMLVVPSGYSPGGRQFFAVLDEHTHHHITSLQSVSPLFENVATPLVPGVQIQITATGIAPEGGHSTVIRHVAPTASNVVLDAPERPYLTSPADQEVGVTTATPFVWSPLGGPAGVSIVQYRAAGRWLTVVTSETTTTIPEVPGYPVAADTTMFWLVYGYAPFADVDAFVAPGAPVDLPNFERAPRVRTDMQYANSLMRRFQTAP